MNKNLIRVKSLILISLTVTITMFVYHSERAYAFDRGTYVTIAEASAITAETAAETGVAIVVAPEVVVALVVGAAAYGGYVLVDTYGDDVCDNISYTIAHWNDTEIKDYVYEYERDGQSYVGLTGDGYDWSVNKVKSYQKTQKVSVSTNKTTTNLTPSVKQPFMDKGFYMVPYTAVDTKNYVSFKVLYGSSVSFHITSAVGSTGTCLYDKTFTPLNDMFYRVHQESNIYYVQTSSDESIWHNDSLYKYNGVTVVLVTVLSPATCTVLVVVE